jgi:hypothetical protein
VYRFVFSARRSMIASVRAWSRSRSAGVHPSASRFAPPVLVFEKVFDHADQDQLLQLPRRGAQVVEVAFDDRRAVAIVFDKLGGTAVEQCREDLAPSSNASSVESMPSSVASLPAIAQVYPRYSYITLFLKQSPTFDTGPREVKRGLVSLLGVRRGCP